MTRRELNVLTLQEPRRRLVVFDVEGVLFPKKRYLFFELGRILGLSEFVRIVFFGFLYEMGVMSLKSALKHLFRVFKGVRTEELLRIFRQVPLMPSIENVLDELRGSCRIALISSGLPTIVVQDLAETLKADYSYGFEIEENSGVLTGEIKGEVIERNGKLLVLRKILEAEHLAPKDCVVVADDRNNGSIFLPDMLKVGYNPDFAIRVKADCVVTGQLAGILPCINGEPGERRTPLSGNDVLRETIHACGFSVPFLAILIGVYSIAFMISVVTLFYIMSELARMERKNLPVISFITRHAATSSELYEFTTAPIFFALGILLTLLLFPSPASGASIAIFALGDSAASIFGKALGKRILPFNKGKTLEGSVAGFIFASIAGLTLVGVPKAFPAAALAMVVESLPLPLNDNVVTPLMTGALLTIMP